MVSHLKFTVIDLLDWRHATVFEQIESPEINCSEFLTTPTSSVSQQAKPKHHVYCKQQQDWNYQSKVPHTHTPLYENNLSNILTDSHKLMREANDCAIETV